ncbi:YlbF family regulator [Numidum massiliense]|uniref:YlbF family regulator n=1 Tax=Numidum massiliense TaxID=1522315 RepID=UPI0006D52F0D|nr:YlbF family regulator [Numidum massiliense]
MASLDFVEILAEASSVSDEIIKTPLVARYLQLKRQLAQDESAQQLIQAFQKKKQLFEEAKRFGHYHPDYHQAKKEARAFQQRMERHPTIGAFLKSEREVDELLFHVSKTIAHAVSTSVKVSANDPRLERQGLKESKSSCG